MVKLKSFILPLFLLTTHLTFAQDTVNDMRAASFHCFVQYLDSFDKWGNDLIVEFKHSGHRNIYYQYRNYESTIPEFIKNTGFMKPNHWKHVGNINPLETSAYNIKYIPDDSSATKISDSFELFVDIRKPLKTDSCYYVFVIVDETPPYVKGLREERNGNPYFTGIICRFSLEQQLVGFYPFMFIE